jgi:trimeric autotransporter adhesin
VFSRPPFNSKNAMPRRRRTPALSHGFTAGSPGRQLRLEQLEDRRMLAAVPQMLTDSSLVDVKYSNPHSFTQVGDLTYFVATSGINTSNEHEQLWRTDGAAPGTQMVTSLVPGAASTQPRSLTDVAGALFFTDDVSGEVDSLWKVDGASGAAERFLNSEGNAFTNVGPFTQWNGVYYFAGSAGGAGVELWRTDGTSAGTWLVKDTRPGAVSGLLGNYIFAASDALYFQAADGDNVPDLWKSDGTEAGTVPVKELRAGPTAGVRPWTTSTDVAELVGVIYFTADAGFGAGGQGLWRSDGTEEGTYLLKDTSTEWHTSNPGQFKAFENLVYFAATDYNGFELWRTDGTAAGTFMVINLPPSSFGSNPHDLTVFNGQLYFSAKYTLQNRL